MICVVVLSHWRYFNILEYWHYALDFWPLTSFIHSFNKIYVHLTAEDQGCTLLCQPSLSYASDSDLLEMQNCIGHTLFLETHTALWGKWVIAGPKTGNYFLQIGI